MSHLWIRAEQRDHEQRVGVTPEGAKALLAAGLRVTVEESSSRAIPITAYQAVGCEIAAEHSWPDAPADAIVFGLKELDESGPALKHRHIMFGHAFKGQPDGKALLRRFKNGGGTLLDLEYLTDETGKRVAAFGYWAGFAGAAVALKCWIAQQRGEIAGPISVYSSSTEMLAQLQAKLVQTTTARPTALIIGALGRVGSGAATLCTELGIPVTKWDMAETASGGPFPEILAHDLFFNCILATPGVPVFVPVATKIADRKLSVIGDIACDPDSDFSPIKVYDRVTTWQAPALRVHETPPLDVTAIDNLPSLLPIESSEDFAEQLLPTLLKLDKQETGVWARAKSVFDTHLATV